MTGAPVGHVTPLGVAVLVVTAVAAALAVISARPELLLVALPLAVALALGIMQRPVDDAAIRHEISNDRLNEGEPLSVTVTVTARTALPFMELLDVVPPGCDVVTGQPRAVISLRAGESTSFTYDLAAMRGVHQLGSLAIRTRDRWGLRAWDARHVDRKLVRVYPRLAAVRSLPRPLHTQTSIGDYVSPALGQGIEPGEIRQFVLGDRIKEVNWRASLRLGSLHVTQHPQERNADVVLMLDTLAHVAEADDGTLEAGVRAAASLAAAYLARKDRVGLITYGGTIDWIKPGTGRAQYERLAEVLLRATVVFTYVSKDLAVVPPRVLPTHALVIAITPLLDSRFTKAALDLAARGFDLVVIVVSPVDVTRRALGPSLADDLACRLWTLERRTRLDDFRRHGIAVLEWRPRDPLETALAGHARRRPRPVVAG